MFFSDTANDPKTQNSVRANLDPEVAARYRDAYAEEKRASKAWGKALHERDAAQKDFAHQVWAVARWRVRSLHPEWFHPNGNKRGEFRNDIDASVSQVARDVWRGVAADDYAAPRMPRVPAAKIVETEEEKAERRARFVERQRQELEAQLALDGDPKHADKLRRLFARFHNTELGRNEQSKAWRAYDDEHEKLTQSVRCQQCGQNVRALQSEVKSSRELTVTEKGGFDWKYICEPCRTKERRERLVAGRRERQAAQRRARFDPHKAQE